MAPLVSFELKENYLLVVGIGKRDNLLEMNEAATQIYAKINETGVRFLLVDYRDLEVNVKMGEAFNIVKRYEVAQPDLKNIIIAAVFDYRGIEFGRFWKDVAGKRGFHIEIFDDIALAERWLKDEMKDYG